ncbi:MAG: cupin domain-containing protein [Oscillospiraceae bacterium]|nr:cupin domain-containing protein [Oscillospiraceae bacterium]
MNNNWLQIPKRIRELREILEITQESFAESLGVPLGDYVAIENGIKDIPVSLLYDIARELKIDFTVLSTGEEPKMDQYSVVRKGDGDCFDRFAGYHYEGLADNFKDREMKPMLVTLEAEDPDPELIAHGGQEFNYVLEGEILLKIGKTEIRLYTGDSIYFNSSIPHAQTVSGDCAKFLAVITD